MNFKFKELSHFNIFAALFIVRNSAKEKYAARKCWCWFANILSIISKTLARPKLPTKQIPWTSVPSTDILRDFLFFCSATELKCSRHMVSVTMLIVFLLLASTLRFGSTPPPPILARFSLHPHRMGFGYGGGAKRSVFLRKNCTEPVTSTSTRVDYISVQ